MAGTFRSQSRDTSISHSPRSYSSDSVATSQSSILGQSLREKSPTRLKRTHNKVRTGCITCRKRRVKCDERKPGCERCAKGDRVCEGYRDVNSKYVEQPRRNADSTVLLPRPNLSNFSTFLDEDNMAEPFVAFLESTAPRMAACFASMIESIIEDKLTVLHLADKAQYLWKTLIPSASQHDTATRYGAVALSSLHQSLETAQTSAWQNQPFAKYYSKAISAVKEGQCSSSHDQILLPCILFAHCELLMGSSSDALAHILSGTRIISGIQSTGESLPAIVTGVIEPVLNGFVAKSQISGQINSGFYFPVATNALVAELEPVPSCFTSLADADRSLSNVLYRTLMLQALGQPSDRHLATATRKYANGWSVAFDAFRFASMNDVPELKRWHLFLLAEHRMVQLLLKSMPPEADNNYQHATADFRVMFAQIQTFLIEQTQQCDVEEGVRQMFPLHPGFIAPLFFIAIHCRVGEIRNNALELLRDLNITEGHWNSCLAHAIASKVVEMSEEVMLQKARPSGTPGIIPHNVKPLSLEWTSGSRLRLQYLEFGSASSRSDVGEVFIEQRTCQHNVSMSWVSAVAH